MMPMDASAQGGSWIARYQQLFDTALPTGAYAHSQGIEGLIQAGEIETDTDLVSFIKTEVAELLIQVEYPLYRLTYETVESGQYERLLEWDRLSRATKGTYELRKSASDVGKQTYRLFEGIFKQSEQTETIRLIQHCSEFFETYQIGVVSAMLAEAMKVPLDAALIGYGQQLISGMVLPSIKLLNIGPMRVQGILFELNGSLEVWKKESLTVDVHEIGSVAPRWDIASSNHQFAERRLFIS